MNLEIHKTPVSSELEALRRKSLVELCDPVRGLAEDIDFSRNPSTARPLDLSGVALFDPWEIL